MENDKIKIIREFLIIFFIVVTTICFCVITSDMHEQSLLDRQFGKLLIEEKTNQTNTINNSCEH